MKSPVIFLSVKMIFPVLIISSFLFRMSILTILIGLYMILKIIKMFITSSLMI